MLPYKKDGILTAQNTSVLFDDINPAKLKSRRYELIIEKSGSGVTGTIAITRKKLNANVYAPWNDLSTGLNTIDLANTDINNAVIPSYELSDSDTLISEVLVIGANIAGGSVRVLLNAW